ncbi:MAG TPA: homoserine kinase [Actinomycetes bacterium]|nr:homoserine kinase [Actinomycetes bacterium]
MGSERVGRVRVAAPATSGNLGPAFDAAGLALDWWDTLDARVTDGPTAIHATGSEAELLPAGPENLVHRAMLALAQEAGAALPALHLSVVKAFPLGRGFGSSAAAVALGLLAARALVAPELPDAVVLALAAELEGHPDNVAPCLAGGATLCWRESGRVAVTGLALHPQLAAVALVAAGPLATAAARAALPGAVPFDLAARTAGRAALLAPALGGAFELLLPATEDGLHQPARLALDAVSRRALETLRERGHAAFLSGAGPSVLVLCHRSALAGVLGDARRALAGAGGWRAVEVGLARTGALATVEARAGG